MKRRINIVVEGSITVKGKELNVSGDAVIYPGKRKADAPKTYKQVGILRHNKGNEFNPDLLTVYVNMQGVYHYSMFRDGGFFPVFGKIVFINPSKGYGM